MKGGVAERGQAREERMDQRAESVLAREGLVRVMLVEGGCGWCGAVGGMEDEEEEGRRGRIGWGVLAVAILMLAQGCTGCVPDREE